MFASVIRPSARFAAQLAPRVGRTQICQVAPRATGSQGLRFMTLGSELKKKVCIHSSSSKSIASFVFHDKKKDMVQGAGLSNHFSNYFFFNVPHHQ